MSDGHKLLIYIKYEMEPESSYVKHRAVTGWVMSIAAAQSDAICHIQLD